MRGSGSYGVKSGFQNRSGTPTDLVLRLVMPKIGGETEKAGGLSKDGSPAFSFCTVCCPSCLRGGKDRKWNLERQERVKEKHTPLT